MATLNLGSIVCTRGVFELMQKDFEFNQFVKTSLVRHSMGDWGDLCTEDRQENELSVSEGFRVLSAYRFNRDCRVWVLTEADRSSTTILFPSEY